MPPSEHNLTFDHMSQKMAYRVIGQPDKPARVFVWAHGWGHSGRNMAPLAEELATLGTHYIIDFPGFGGSPVPATPYTLEDYAQLAASFIKSLPNSPQVVWIGHSFGCRVGLMLGAHMPEVVERMVLIAAPGLPIRRSLYSRLRGFIRSRMFRLLKALARNEAAIEALRMRYGSADYRAAGALRPTFVNIVNRGLSDEAAKSSVPARLIYGADDSETPPDIGERLHKLMHKSDLTILPGQDHYTVLTSGRQQVLPLIKEFVQ